ncbi:MAG: FAD-dependent oxidoreductase [Pelomonas sp.]|nr:FAD-dependent oxidoreductase [Roseateles sp.]
MLDVAIVGGGVCGLALASSLQARRVDWALFEGRGRLGGRVLTVTGENGAPLDLGATWFWPATQPVITQLVADLALPTLAQPDDGQLLVLDDAARPPQARSFDAATGQAVEGLPPQPGSLHGGARRLAGGMQALVDALAARLPPGRLHLGQRLRRLQDLGDAVALHFDDGTTLQARRVVLALPPRLALDQIRLTPPLPDAVQAAMRGTPTWMAHAAKAALPCRSPVWREQGHTGNAWVTHAQAVLAEVFDASGAAGAALAGFIALPAAQRARFERSLPLLLESQLAMLFGHHLQPLGAHWQDWAADELCCSAADREEDGRGGHPGQHAAEVAQLQAPLWAGRLWLGGSETARQGTGYLEGALRAAGRLRAELDRAMLAHP